MNVSRANCESISLPSTKTCTRFHGPEEIPGLDLSELVIHTSYRGHPQLGHQDHEALFRHELLSAAEDGGMCASITIADKVSAACSLKPLVWDSEHFGMPMAKLSLAASSGCTPDKLLDLLRSLLSASPKAKPGLHVSCEIDIDNYLCLNTLLDLGAKIFDIKREFRCVSLSQVHTPKLLSRVRAFQPEDKVAVMQLLDSSGFETRFSRDPVLDPGKTAAMYRRWLEKLLDGNADDRIALVMERNEKVHACGAIERRNLGSAGVDLQLMTGGIYISSPSGIGSYYPILYSLIAEAAKRNMTSQTCVSLNNHSATRVLEKMNVGTASVRYAMRLLA